MSAKIITEFYGWGTYAVLRIVVHEGHIATNYHVVEDMFYGRAKLVEKKKFCGTS